MSSAFRISIGANIGLMVVVAVLLWRQQPAAAPSAVAPATRPAAARSEAPVAGAVAKEPQPRSTGSQITPAAIVQLEQMGISRGILSSAVLEQFNHSWDKRLMELEKKHAPRQMPERDYVEFARLREAEQVRELKEALGEEGYLAWDKERTLRSLNGAGLSMTPQEAEQAYRLQKDFEEKHKELQMAMEDGVADLADGAALQTQAQEVLNRELEKLLGQQRFNEMRGLTEPIAEVHWKYGDLHPTPDQANAVLSSEEDYRAREAALAARLNAAPADAATVAAELKAMNEARDENLRRIFGAEAYDQMKRESDPTYKKLQQFADAWELKAPDVESVYDAVRVFQDETERTRAAAAMRETAGQPVNWREIDASIEQARQQTEAGLQNLIGGERLRRLKQNGVLSGR